MTWEMLQSGSFSLKPRFEAYSGEFAKISSLLTSPPKLPENRKLTASYTPLATKFTNCTAGRLTASMFVILMVGVGGLPTAGTSIRS